jgi:hypothetical protein
VLHAPAVRALIIQCVSFLLTILVIRSIGLLTELRVTLLVAVLLQGTLAATLSYWRHLAPWWLAIQFLFPGALMAMLSLSLPPGIFLALFIFLLGLYWSIFRTQVPFYPSGPVVWEAVAALLPADRPVRFIDIGSGLGGLVLNLTERRPESAISGIELAPLPWLASWLRAALIRSRARFFRGDYTQLDFAQYDVVFAYLSPAAMLALWEKSRTEMQPGAMLLSYEFPIPGVTADVMVMPQSEGAILYAWRF